MARSLFRPELAPVARRRGVVHHCHVASSIRGAVRACAGDSVLPNVGQISDLDVLAAEPLSPDPDGPVPTSAGSFRHHSHRGAILGRFQALRVPPNPRWVVAQSLQRLCASQKVSESVTEPDDRWPIVQILDGKDARWCPSCGYSLRTCILRAMNSDPQGERCCDECDHPPWERSERPLLDHPVETEPDLGAGWGPGDLHMTTNPNDPINFHWP
jgi:hypothetical protein